jgi:hypothetical protein
MSKATIDTHLAIVQGNIKSIEDIKRALTTSGYLPDRVLFAIGGAPTHQLSIRAPATLDDPHVCEEGMKALISALRSCIADNVTFGPLGSRPAVFAISATGVSSRRDISMPLYHTYVWYLTIPLGDKAAMENTLVTAALGKDSPLGAFAIVRLMALSDGAAKGLNKLKTGWVWPDIQRKEKLADGQEEAGPQKGFAVSRADVGHWIFENLINDDGTHYGKCTTLSY